MRRFHWIAAVIAVAAGCGGDVNGGEPLSAEETEDLCAEGCAHWVACLWRVEQELCEADCAVLSSRWRGDGFRQYLECTIDADCSEGTAVGAACYLEVAGRIESRPIHDEFAMRCDAAREACGEIALVGCELDEVILYADAYMTTYVMPCFDLDCFGLAGCLDDNVLDGF